MLRQDPEECLFQFICSSNNHIKRIHGMVERLCRAYGTPLHVVASPGQHPRLCYHSFNVRTCWFYYCVPSCYSGTATTLH